MYHSISQNTEITYVLIEDRPDVSSVLLPPLEFYNSAIRFVKKCPLDILQLFDGVAYYKSRVNQIVDYPKQFRFMYSDQALEFINNSLDRNKIHLFLFGDHCPVKDEIVEMIVAAKSDLWFWSSMDNYDDLGNREVRNPLQFIQTLLENKKEILNVFDLEPEIDLMPSIDMNLNVFNYSNYFKQSQLNNAVLAEIIGNYGISNSLNEEEQLKVQSEALVEATKKKNSFDRLDQSLVLVERNDAIHENLSAEGVFPSLSGADPQLPPLILIAPFHNPDFKKLIEGSIDPKHAEIIKLLGTEQTNNFTHLVDSKSNMELIHQSMIILSQKVDYLDDVAYLHSSFTQSPIVRLPIRGRSLNRILSFFRPQFHAALSNPRNRTKIFRTMQKFGRELQSTLISEKLCTNLVNKERQIVLISDLPFEWAEINSVPLAFSHDVCRIPEISYAGIMSQFMSNAYARINIDKDILNKTLVVFGNNEADFQRWHKIVQSEKVNIGCQFAVCRSISELKKKLDEIEPKFVIFDCHGGINKETGETYLEIGEDLLTTSKIIEHNISIPIVFLSACGTTPTYGLFNSVANGFFQNGSLSVTSTYLPIGVDSGGLLYTRVLMSLKTASKNAIHKNWLSFMSHICRTSGIMSAYNESKDERELEHRSVMNARSMYFNERRKIYKQLNDPSALNYKAKKISDQFPEYLFYSHLGRPDLIYFKSWIEEVEFKKNTEHETPQSQSNKI